MHSRKFKVKQYSKISNKLTLLKKSFTHKI